MRIRLDLICVHLRASAVVLPLAFGGPAWGAADPVAREVQRNLQQRQHQQDQLQLRMQQQQHGVQSPPADARRKRAIEHLETRQRQRQQELQYRQQIEPPSAQPSDDEGTRQAKAEMRRQRVQEQGRQQLRRFGSELRQAGHAAERKSKD